MGTLVLSVLLSLSERRDISNGCENLSKNQTKETKTSWALFLLTFRC